MQTFSLFYIQPRKTVLHLIPDKISVKPSLHVKNKNENLFPKKERGRKKCLSARNIKPVRMYKDVQTHARGLIEKKSFFWSTIFILRLSISYGTLHFNRKCVICLIS